MKVQLYRSSRPPGLIFRIILILFVLTTVSPGITKSQDPARRVKIGLLIQDSSCRAALQGAGLAVLKANEKGGLNNRKIELVVRSMEGPWGTGSKKAVELIFDEKVWALLGSHDGRNAHLVEQAATKSQVVFVSAWSGDPTLSRAFIPWFFNCVPDNYQQAGALFDEIFNKRKIRNVAIVSDGDYDSGQALSNFLKKTSLEGGQSSAIYKYEDYSRNTDKLADQIIKSGAGCIILFCRPSSSIKIFREIRMRDNTMPVFGSLNTINEDELSESELEDLTNDLLVAAGAWPDKTSSEFKEEFIKTYGISPGIVSAYAFDATNVLIEALKKSGTPDFEKIREAISVIEFEGVTGTLKFDDRGNRQGSFKPVTLKNGGPALTGAD